MTHRHPILAILAALRGAASRALVPALAIGLAWLAATAGCSSPPRGTKASAAAAAADSLQPPLVPITAEGVRTLAAASGRATLVNVWASWCAPCREEFPELLAVASEHRGDLRLLLVSADLDDDLPAVRRFLTAHGVRDTSYVKSGDDQKFINGIHPAWTGALPATLVLDASGRVVAFWEGRADSLKFATAVSAALAASHS